MDDGFFAPPAPPTSGTVTRERVAPPRHLQRTPHLGIVLVGAGVLAMMALVVGLLSSLTRTGATTLDRKSSAFDATIQSDLRQFAVREADYFAENGQYGGAQELGLSLLPGASGTQITAMYDDRSFCLLGAHLGTKNAWYYDSARGLLPLGQTCS
jgi:hypothetical protein